MTPIEELEKLEEKLVNKRRTLVSGIVAVSALGPEVGALVDIQCHIDAVKSAIKDENSRDPSV